MTNFSFRRSRALGRVLLPFYFIRTGSETGSDHRSGICTFCNFYTSINHILLTLLSLPPPLLSPCNLPLSNFSRFFPSLPSIRYPLIFLFFIPSYSSLLLDLSSCLRVSSVTSSLFISFLPHFVLFFSLSLSLFISTLSAVITNTFLLENNTARRTCVFAENSFQGRIKVAGRGGGRGKAERNKNDGRDSVRNHECANERALT